MFRNIVVLLDDEVINSNFLNLATNIAKTSEGSISGVYVSPLTRTMLSMPEAVDVESFREKAQTVHDKLQSTLKLAGLKGVWFYAECRDVVAEVLRHGLYADLIMISCADGNYKTMDKVLLAASSPTMLIPFSNNSNGSFKRILVAWKNTRESARAFHDSLPLLHKATDIRIVTFGENDYEKQSLTRYLKMHGINAVIDQHPIDKKIQEYGQPMEIDKSIGNKLLLLSKEYDSELIVMGAFGHSRLGDAVLSGVTLEISRNTKIPVMMSH